MVGKMVGLRFQDLVMVEIKHHNIKDLFPFFLMAENSTTELEAVK